MLSDCVVDLCVVCCVAYVVLCALCVALRGVYQVFVLACCIVLYYVSLSCQLCDLWCCVVWYRFVSCRLVSSSLSYRVV